MDTGDYHVAGIVTNLLRPSCHPCYPAPCSFYGIELINAKTRWLCECHCNRRCNCGGMAAPDVPHYRANAGQAAVAAEANPLKEVYGTM